MGLAACGDDEKPAAGPFRLRTVIDGKVTLSRRTYTREEIDEKLLTVLGAAVTGSRGEARRSGERKAKRSHGDAAQAWQEHMVRAHRHLAADELDHEYAGVPPADLDRHISFSIVPADEGGKG